VPERHPGVAPEQIHEGAEQDDGGDGDCHAAPPRRLRIPLSAPPWVPRGRCLRVQRTRAAHLRHSVGCPHWSLAPHRQLLIIANPFRLVTMPFASACRRECDKWPGRDQGVAGRMRDVFTNLIEPPDVCDGKPMPNERLRTAILEQGLTPAKLAEAIEVDPKSVERWIGGRMPYRRHRYAVAARLGVDELYLWPDALSAEQVASASEGEIIHVYPHRSLVPFELWRNVFANAEDEIGILVYSGLFVAEDAGMQRIFRQKAQDGVRVRILLGDPDSDVVAQRGSDEGVDGLLTAKIHNAVVLYRPLLAVQGIEFRLHQTVLYNSIYRSDEQVLVNTHIYGFPAAQAPVLHLRRTAGGGMVSTYLESFDHVWDNARPLK
jgi:transcriptional regulator with XRE-family HTH domain